MGDGTGWIIGALLCGTVIGAGAVYAGLAWYFRKGLWR